MNEHSEDIFDEKKIKRAIKKGKMKSIITIVFVSLLVFVVLNIANFAISVYFSHKAFKQSDAYVRLSTPNGYISETVDSWGFLGGMSHYKIAKDMKIKSLVVEQKQYQYGLIPSILVSRGAGGSIGVTGEDWQFSYKENGWRKMMFFHPNVAYKKYKNDEELIKSMGGEKIYEVALSFDKPYKQSELPIMQLPQMTWFWVNTYSNSQLDTLQQEAKEHDWSATFIRENEALGFSVRDTYTRETDLAHEYDKFLKLLKTSNYSEHKQAYDTMKDINIDDVEILGVVVYGTKDEIVEIMKSPIIKASSLGGVIDNY
ncbi:Sigma factor regulator N-terminal/Sigma factor regulator C-terminal [Schinkia azotoformans MEV2011]|uniref:Sigma factor regulator N-terminal/Sigma factor regulator C-terminal n=1 Tax=Schinkia azotoformans MEV2011 TaxID=1348973 RepID=A0A072NFR6_SCHAZ|nr:anti sigma factor C-terminal domain-containing protein [Schinkia azotoformans]KEF36391.1 Sigma factor regulator N-terminal/Sigma factor regulator C-terminal [Schinkia azotoformans MEV2011]MEC1697330.1 anti sigma factor C-terminal domain-containing protein [Schinkia azotoformans]MEC1717367.1 anti sigma factor C-terminal domain-containing protein [Schinkia azotoformans]MEC1724586.1 anti sigma factor C-terminal domain-containing protein [Schinkia azotoformans]MEC1741626.1 anti sigma factor C-t